MILLHLRSIARSPLLAVSVLIAGASWGATPAAHAADPFYLDLLRDGSRALEAGDHEEANRLLRLACFGLLEEPELLARCLVELSLAQAGIADRQQFHDTFDRIVTLERRFQAYSRAELPSGLRDRFAERAVGWLTAADVEAIPALSAAFDRKVEAELAALPPDRRRQRLGTLLAEEPGDARWARMLAELEIADGNATAAASAASAVLQLEPNDPVARCIQGRARAVQGQCSEEALTELSSCLGTAHELEARFDRLECLSSLARWEEAASEVTAIGPQIGRDSRARRLARRVEKELEKISAAREREERRAASERARLDRQAARQPADSGSPTVPQPAGTAGAGSEATATPPQANEPGSTAETRPSGEPAASATLDESEAPSAPNIRSEPTLSAAELTTLDRARAMTRAASLISELEEPMSLARPIADRNPEHRGAQHLVAEIAYRASDWALAVRYFDRGGDPAEALLSFYQAVALYEVGERDRAADAMRRSLEGLNRGDPWVDSQIERILGRTGG